VHSELLALPDFLRNLADLLRVDASEMLRKLLQIVAIWLFCWLGNRLVKQVARRIEMAVDDGDDNTLTEREQRGRTISQLLRSVGRVVLVFLGLLLTFKVFIDITPILAGAGILGLAVSFGAQSLVKDVISGFFYLVEGQFAVGDVIEVAGKTGEVERMTLRVVMLRDLHGTLHTVPNGQIVTVSNFTSRWSRAVVEVGVGYETDVDRALQVFRDEALRFSRDEAWRSKFDGDPEIAGIIGLDENAVNIRVLFRTHPGQQWSVAREFRRRIKTRLDREKIEIPTAQRTIRIRTDAGADPPGAALSGPATRLARAGRLPSPEPPVAAPGPVPPVDVAPPADSHE
jgi:moderate conductance mechanosensitive channel